MAEKSATTFGDLPDCYGYGTVTGGSSYIQSSNIKRTLVGYKIVDHPDVDAASPVGAAPTTSSFSTQHPASMDWAETKLPNETRNI